MAGLQAFGNRSTLWLLAWEPNSCRNDANNRRGEPNGANNIDRRNAMPAKPPRAAAQTRLMPKPEALLWLAAIGAVAATVLWAALPAPAFGAGAFDGSYRGTQRTLRSNGSGECANLNHDNMLLVIEDNHFNRHWGSADLAVDVAADGSFSKKQVAGGRPLRTIDITGRISNGNLEADIGTDLCAAHLSLKKS